MGKIMSTLYHIWYHDLMNTWNKNYDKNPGEYGRDKLHNLPILLHQQYPFISLSMIYKNK